MDSPFTSATKTVTFASTATRTTVSTVSPRPGFDLHSRRATQSLYIEPVCTSTPAPYPDLKPALQQYTRTRTDKDMTYSYMNLMLSVPAIGGNRVPPDTWQPLMTTHTGNVTDTPHTPLTLNISELMKTQMTPMTHQNTLPCDLSQCQFIPTHHYQEPIHMV